MWYDYWKIQYGGYTWNSMRFVVNKWNKERRKLHYATTQKQMFESQLNEHVGAGYEILVLPSK